MAKTVDRLYRRVQPPRGAKLRYVDRADGWFDQSVLEHTQAMRELAEAIDALPRYQQLGAGFRTLVDAVHKASNYTVYVGRAGATPKHVRGRFQVHIETRSARWIRPVFKADTDLMRSNRWEEVAIKWVKMHDARDALCCANDVADDRGSWPQTDDTVIYVVAC